VHAAEPALQRLGAHRDRGQRIVDLVGHACGEKTDAGQLLAAYHLASPQLHLAVEVVADLLEPLGHVVEGVRQFRHLVAGIEPDAIPEIACRHAPRAMAEEPQRPEDPAVGDHRDRRQQRGRSQGGGGRGEDERVIAAADLAGEVVKPVLKEGGQFGRERREPFQMGGRRCQHPPAAVIGRQPRQFVEGGGDVAGRGPLPAPVAEWHRLDLPFVENVPIAVEQHVRLAQRLAPCGGLRFIAGEAAGLGEPQSGDAAVERAGTGQFRSPAGECANEPAVGIDADEARRRERDDHDAEQQGAEHQFFADRPTALHDRPPCRRTSAARRCAGRER
jgi:hypothetical protein